jgi:hypothetical protein
LPREALVKTYRPEETYVLEHLAGDAVNLDLEAWVRTRAAALQTAGLCADWANFLAEEQVKHLVFEDGTCLLGDWHPTAAGWEPNKGGAYGFAAIYDNGNLYLVYSSVTAGDDYVLPPEWLVS